MYETPDPATRFYRGTRPDEHWTELLSGEGSYYSFGGRYNHPRLLAVYASDDPLVAIAETAFYSARSWQGAIGERLPPSSRADPPFISVHRLWCFTLDPPPRVINVSDPTAVGVFGHRPISLRNPSRDYRTTQDLAGKIINHPTPGPHSRGLKAPSVRSRGGLGYGPHQYVFFPGLGGLKGRLVRRWRLTIEFLDHQDQPVQMDTLEVNWGRPRFRLTGSRSALPAFAPRPGDFDRQPRAWHRIDIRFA